MQTSTFKILAIIFMLQICLMYNIDAQCNNFNNSIILNAAGTVNGCNQIPPSTTATICADFNITFSGGNASFYWGYTITNAGVPTTSTFGPINTSQTSQFPNIVCVSVPCGASITFFVTAYSNPNGGGSQCNNANATVSTIPFSPLPIILADFSGYHKENKIHLNWKTLLEINNDYFEVWKSKNGLEWNLLGKVDGNGNTQTSQSYSFIDNFEVSPKNFYKLIQYDFDGKFATSDIISINRTVNEVIFSYSTSNELQIAAPWPQYTVDLYDISGKILSSQTYQTNNTVLSLQTLPSNIYLIRVRSDEHVVTKKIFVP